MTSPNTAAGQRWEAVAARHLEAHGLEILRRGYRCRLGEIDLICRDARTLVIVEVRARGTTGFATALESIGHAKRRRIVNATRHFLMRHPRFGNAPVRFDVVAVENAGSDAPELNWVRNAFEAA